ncbi:hypothetical protein ACFE04_011442 [Oxalis oulophora]
MEELVQGMINQLYLQLCQRQKSLPRKGQTLLFPSSRRSKVTNWRAKNIFLLLSIPVRATFTLLSSQSGGWEILSLQEQVSHESLEGLSLSPSGVELISPWLLKNGWSEAKRERRNCFERRALWENFGSNMEAPLASASVAPSLLPRSLLRVAPRALRVMHCSVLLNKSLLGGDSASEGSRSQTSRTPQNTNYGHLTP